MAGGDDKDRGARRGAEQASKEEVAAALERAANKPNQTADEQAEEGPDAPGSREGGGA
jgi:hypothetical protein